MSALAGGHRCEAGRAWSRGSERAVGHGAIAANIKALTDKGLKVRWSPSASALTAAADMGFTAGEYRLEGATGTVGRGVYVTVWRRGADGHWRVVFDSGVATAM